MRAKQSYILILAVLTLCALPSEAHAFGSIQPKKWIKKIFGRKPNPTPTPTPLPTATPTPTFTPIPGDDSPNVHPEDVLLTLPDSRGHGEIGANTGYEMHTGCPFSNPALCEVPIYRPYTTEGDPAGWWDNLVDELLYARFNSVMMVGRGCFDQNGDEGNGNMCPRRLRHMIAAIDRAGARNAMKLGMFDDTGAYQGARAILRGLPHDAKFDLADRADSLYFFWDLNVKIWFDTVPRDLWYLIDGRPVIQFWGGGPSMFDHFEGNVKPLFAALRQKFQERYGVNPFFILDQGWYALDSTMSEADGEGRNEWFAPAEGKVGSFRLWNGRVWGTATGAFRIPGEAPGCGQRCWEVPRGPMGSTFKHWLDQSWVENAFFTLVEGFTDIFESNGTYRSEQWEYPSLYLNHIREKADPEPDSLRFQAEAADAYRDHSGGNEGTAFRDGDIDIAPLSSGGGWTVGWTEPGEWLEFKGVFLGSGHYRFTARFATPVPNQRVHLEIDGNALPSVTLDATGDWQRFDLAHLGAVSLAAGRHDIRLVFDSGNVNLDWYFLKRR